MASERRNSDQRRELLSLVVDYEGAEALVQDYTQNLSSGGVFIHTDRQLAVGDTVQLQLSFPRLLEPICIAGIVRWVREVSENDSGVGIEFTDFDEDTRAKLESVLRRVDMRDPELVEPSLRVLLVEDNPHVANLIKNGLGSGRFSATAFDFYGAFDGKEALEMLATDDYDVLVIDVNLPVLDGPTVIRRARQIERLQDLPIIAISAGGQQASTEAMDAGADFFLEKPMRLRDVVETMRQLLHFD